VEFIHCNTDINRVNFLFIPINMSARNAQSQLANVMLSSVDLPVAIESSFLPLPLIFSRSYYPVNTYNHHVIPTPFSHRSLLHAPACQCPVDCGRFVKMSLSRRFASIIDGRPANTRKPAVEPIRVKAPSVTGANIPPLSLWRPSRWADMK